MLYNYIISQAAERRGEGVGGWEDMDFALLTGNGRSCTAFVTGWIRFKSSDLNQ